MTSRGRSSTRDDADRVKDAAHKLRTENRKLRKEVSRLKKELNRFDSGELDEPDQVEADAEMVPVYEKPEDNPKCPKCKAENYLLIPAGKYRINLCKACGYRNRQEVKR